MAISKYQGRRVRRVLFLVPLVLVVCFFLSRKFDLFEKSTTRGNDPIPPTAQKLQASPPKHDYHPDGRLLADSDSPHPILELIRTAEDVWAMKEARASRTLDQAVKEYMRRYKREPPPGFDHWWSYVQEHNVKLPDDYDSIHEDIEPLWSIEPRHFPEMIAQRGNTKDTFTIGKNKTSGVGLFKVAALNSATKTAGIGRRGLKEMIELLRPVEHLLPNFRAVISSLDTPRLLSNYHFKNAALDAMAADVNFASIENPSLGYVSACAPHSPGRRREVAVNLSKRPMARARRSFVWDHLSSMNPCLHTNIFYRHPQFLGPNVQPSPETRITPLFSRSSTFLHHDLRLPSLFGLDDGSEDMVDLPWSEKRDDRLYWRGNNSGMDFHEKSRWRHSQRVYLVEVANDLNGEVNILFPRRDNLRIRDGQDLPKSIVNPAFMDVSFSGEPIGCVQPYCDFLKTQYEWRDEGVHNRTGFADHKYVIDLDGSGPSSEFRRLMATNSLVFKATIYPEWWLERSQAWVHYVPVQVDLSDLYDTYVFFRGSFDGDHNHEGQAEKLALAGKEWTKTYWRKEDMTAYVFRLLLEYARVTSVDRDATIYQGH